MTKLIAIGYDDEASAGLAEREVRRLAGERVFVPAGVVAVSRDREGRFARAGAAGRAPAAAWDTLRGLLALAALRSRRPLVGMAVGAAAVIEPRNGVDRAFEQDVRDMLEPGASALFLAVDTVTPDEAIESLSRFGGTVLKSSLSREAEHDLADALHRPPPGRR
jgi:uncharacterized membrane protein